MAITPIPTIPKPHKLAKLSLSGFTVTSAQAGEGVWLCQKDSVTSENPRFYVYAEQIGAIVFPELKIATELVNRFLIIVHPDESADVYVNVFPETFIMKPTEGTVIKSGTIVYKKDISSIEKASFPGIKIEPKDQIIYLNRTGFRFGIYFNLSREIDLDKMYEDIGKLKNTMVLDDIVKIAQKKSEELEKENYDAYITTEGKTDWKHIAKAYVSLQEKASLVFDDFDKTRGDSGLLTICETLSAHEIHTKPIICIFDNDNPNTIAELQKRTEGKKLYQNWGNNVYSLLLPIPKDRAGYKNISVEMLYSDKILATKDKSGKRLFFSNELETIISNTTKKKIPSPRIISPKTDEEFDKKVEDQDVAQIVDEKGNQVALSKSLFADQVFSGERSLSKDDFKNFVPAFDIIRQIIENAKQNPKKMTIKEIPSS